MSDDPRARYKIVRFFQDPNKSNRTIERGLTLARAQAHCNDPDSSSSTTTSATGRRRTREHGAWFDGYRAE
jgi:hypothetical protein